MERFIPVEIFRKKSNTFRGITFFPVFTETTEIFCTICLDYQCQASSREKANNLPVFCKWYNSIPLLFSVPKKYQYHLTEIFHRNFRTNGKRSLSCVLVLQKPRKKSEISHFSRRSCAVTAKKCTKKRDARAKLLFWLLNLLLL